MPMDPFGAWLNTCIIFSFKGNKIVHTHGYLVVQIGLSKIFVQLRLMITKGEEIRSQTSRNPKSHHHQYILVLVHGFL